MSAPRPLEHAPHTRGRTLDHAAAVYDILAPVMTLGQEGRYRKAAIRLLDLQGGERVLDVGCGTGVLTRQIAQRLSGPGARVVGLDAAPKMIQVARRHAVGLPHVRFDVGVAETLTYGDSAFDCAVSTFFFLHIDVDLKRRALAELRRVIKPGHAFGRIPRDDIARAVVAASRASRSQARRNACGNSDTANSRRYTPTAFAGAP